jgi:hypothetical protein
MAARKQALAYFARARCCRQALRERRRGIVFRQNSFHLRFQQLCLSFSQPKFSRSKFDPTAETPWRRDLSARRRQLSQRRAERSRLVGEPDKVARKKATESKAVNEAFAEQALILNISKVSERI